MGSRTVDLRSDTVTKPTEAMRAAMANAEVDDDVLVRDPSCFRLETEMAKIMGKEAAIFVPSGTMANLISVLVHCDIRGSEVILGDNSHIHIYENGGIATLGGVHPRPLKNNQDGTIDIHLIEAAIRDPKRELVFPTTRLICLENTHGNCGGRCLSVEYTDRVGEVAKKHGLKLHIDGARIFNAAVALGVSVDRLVQAADSVSVCLSKGLGAPVGSVIVGSNSFITKARRLRKTLGGGMRQVGVLCAPALVALHQNVGNLQSDHNKARFLADGLNGIKGLRLDTSSVETNITTLNPNNNNNNNPLRLIIRIQPRQREEWRWHHNRWRNEHTYQGLVMAYISRDPGPANGPLPLAFHSILTLDLEHNNPFVILEPPSALHVNGEEINLDVPDDYYFPPPDYNSDRDEPATLATATACHSTSVVVVPTTPPENPQ